MQTASPVVPTRAAVDDLGQGEGRSRSQIRSDLYLSVLKEIEYPSPRPPEPILLSAANDQAASTFADERERIQLLNPKIDWLRPSLADIDRELLDRATIDVGANEGDPEIEAVVVGAGALRGIILHKLMEELLTGLLAPDLAHLNDRASTLAQEAISVEAAVPDSSELADTVLRTFSNEKLKPYIAKLVPEVPLYGARSDTVLVSARADAIAFEAGTPIAVFDWKSDVAPTPDDDRAYASQLLGYLELIGAERGAVVYMTSGYIRWVHHDAGGRTSASETAPVNRPMHYFGGRLQPGVSRQSKSACAHRSSESRRSALG